MAIQAKFKLNLKTILQIHGKLLVKVRNEHLIELRAGVVVEHHWVPEVDEAEVVWLGGEVVG